MSAFYLESVVRAKVKKLVYLLKKTLFAKDRCSYIVNVTEKQQRENKSKGKSINRWRQLLVTILHIIFSRKFFITEVLKSMKPETIYHRPGNTADFGSRDVIVIRKAIECLPSPAGWRYAAASYELRVNKNAALVLRKNLSTLV